MSSTKAEVLNVSQRRQRRTDPWLYVMCTKIGEDWPCSFRVMRADRQTDILITILHTPSGIDESIMSAI